MEGLLLLLLASQTHAFLLPAYSHNDYENSRPLQEALERGYQGVEVDYFVQDGQLLAAHDKQDLDPGRTLDDLYLRPLASIVAKKGFIHSDGSAFILNIEAKQPGAHSYAALRDLLAKYESMLTIVRDGIEEQGPVTVILVGWHPTMGELQREAVRYVSVHKRIENLTSEDAHLPVHLLRMISVEYRKHFLWRGQCRAPRGFRSRLKKMVELSHDTPRRIVRLFNVPVSRRIYRELMGAHVDYIGTKKLKDTQKALHDIHG